MSLKKFNTHLLTSTTFRASGAQHALNVSGSHGAKYIGYKTELYLFRQTATAFGDIDFVTNGVLLHFPAGVVEIDDARGATELLPLISKAVLQAPEFSDRATVVAHEAFRFRITAGCNRDFLADSLKISFEGCPDLLSQAYAIGCAIDRVPYTQYLDGYDKNGYLEVVFHGFAQCKNGVLQFHPDGRVIRVTPDGAGSSRLQVPGQGETKITLSADDLEFSDQQAARRREVRKARGSEH